MNVCADVSCTFYVVPRAIKLIACDQQDNHWEIAFNYIQIVVNTIKSIIQIIFFIKLIF